MRKVLKKMRDLLVSITFSKPREFDKLHQKSKKDKKKGGDKKEGLKSIL